MGPRGKGHLEGRDSRSARWPAFTDQRLCAGASGLRAENWVPWAPHGASGVVAGAGYVFFSYIGFDSVCTLVSGRPLRQPDIEHAHTPMSAHKITIMPKAPHLSFRFPGSAPPLCKPPPSPPPNSFWAGVCKTPFRADFTQLHC